VIQNAWEITKEDSSCRKIKRRTTAPVFGRVRLRQQTGECRTTRRLEEIAKERNERRYIDGDHAYQRIRRMSGALRKEVNQFPDCADTLWNALPRALKGEPDDTDANDATNPATPVANAESEKAARPGETDPQRWSRRVRTGESVEDLVGWRFQGEGFAAPHSIWVYCRGLQELDLLRNVDYLSTSREAAISEHGCSAMCSRRNTG
jgi:hypothetical protein